MSVRCNDFGLFEKMDNTVLKVDIRLRSMTQKGVFMQVLPLWTLVAYKLAKLQITPRVRDTNNVKKTLI